MYYRLNATLNANAGYLKKEDNFDETLMFGMPIDESQIVLPWPYSLTARNNKPVQFSDFYPGALLMSTRLVETLRSCGVDNLQTFSAAIVDKVSKQPIDGYLVVNVLGLVGAADLAASKSRAIADLKFFEKLVIDPGKARNLQMFRLAESRSDIIVDKKTALAIEAGNFVDVMLEPLA